MRRVAVAAVLLSALCASQVGAAAEETTLVSRAGAVAADNNSSSGAVSPDGRYVAFVSSADNLVTGENEAALNAFLHDTQTGSTILVSRETGAAGAGADDGSGIGLGAVSSGGRFVIFSSTANNLATGENEAVNNVFLRDTQTDTTTLISRATGVDGAPADDNSVDPTISADGRYVAYTSLANNLATGENETVSNIFVRDTQMDATILASRNSAGEPADGGSFDPMISGNGQFVVFESNAANMSATDVDPQNDIFRRDLSSGATTLASVQSAAAGGGNADAPSFDPTVSADGRMVAFSSDADNLGTATPAAFFHVYVRDVQTQETLLVSRQSAADGGAQADAFAEEAMVSGDGRRVVFESIANNLSTADDDTKQNIYVRDLPTNATILASRQSAAEGGAGADGNSAVPSVSDDGRFVAFHSDANNLSTLDNDALLNVFLRDLTAAVGGGGGGTTLDTVPPALELTAKKSQVAGKPLKLEAEANEACELDLSGSAKPKGEKKGKLKPLTEQLAAGAKESLKLKAAGKLKQALKAADKGKAKLAGICTDAAGNPSQEVLKVKLK